MNSVKLTVRTLGVINEMFSDVTGYGDERQSNHTIELSKEDDTVKMTLTYNDTNKVIFSGYFSEDAFLEAAKIEDEKEEDEDE